MSGNRLRLLNLASASPQDCLLTEKIANIISKSNRKNEYQLFGRFFFSNANLSMDMWQISNVGDKIGPMQST